MKKIFTIVAIMFLMACTPVEEKVNENMKLSDYLEKMATGEKLNSAEIAHMKTLVDETTEKVSMWSKDGPDTLTVRKLRAQDAFYEHAKLVYINVSGR